MVVVASMVFTAQQEEIIYAGHTAAEIGHEVVGLKLNAWFRAPVPCAHSLHGQKEDSLLNAREAGAAH